jgi:hypothetical protein
VEFALVLPLFVVLSLAVIEFGFAFHAVLSINFASRDAALIAAEAGNGEGADCIILDSIERDVSAPTDPTLIGEVEIYWADSAGAQIPGAVNTYSRTGSTTCHYPGGLSVTVPYEITNEGYPEDERCNILAGCGGGHDGLDLVGVRITYTHGWKTPLHAFIPAGSGGFGIDRSNAMRMEPIL